MSCDEILTLFAEGLTGPDRRPSPEVAEHLAACASCRAEAEAMRATLGAVRGLAAPEAAPVAPPSFESVLARTRSPVRRARRGLGRAALLAVALVAGAAADRLWFASAHAPAPVPPPRTEAAPVASDVFARAASRDSVRREVAAHPGGLGASLAVLASLGERR